MKCPFCGIELIKIVQEYPPKYNLPTLYLYDHKETSKCKHGDGNTLTEERWRERKANQS